jgi:tripartite-type tricarboxylate transporter receptor subunit TctC
MATAGSAICQTVEEFYKQKSTIRLIHGAGAGSTYNTWGQVVARHMQKYIPGNPKIIVESMPGGGGIIAGNRVYSVAPKDGTVIASLSRNMPLQAFLGKEKSIVFDPRQFNWLGSVEVHVRVCAVRADSGVTSVKELLEKEVTVGGTGPGSGQSYLPTVLNKLVGTKFKVVTGYRSDQEIHLAIERGEVSGTCGNYDTIITAQKALLDTGKMHILFNLERRQNSGIKGVPWIGEYMKNEEDKQLFAFITSPTDFGRPYLTPPGVPSDRVAALKKAFEQTMVDPEFQGDVKKVGFDLIPSTGEELTQAINDLYATPKAVVDKAVAIMPEGGMGD